MTLDSLDEKSYRILEAIYENGGSANTTEIKEYTGIEKNAIVHYRYDKLEDSELIEIERESPEGNRIPAKRAILTEKAQNHIQNGLFEDQELTVVDRLNRLESQFDNVLTEFEKLKREIRDFRYDEKEDRELTAREIAETVEEFREIKEIYDTHIDFEARIQENDQVIAENIEKIDDLSKLVYGTRADIESLESDMAEIKEEIEGKDTQSVESAVQDIENTAYNAQSKAESAQDKTQTLREEVDQLQSQVDQLRKEHNQGILSNILPR